LNFKIKFLTFVYSILYILINNNINNNNNIEIKNYKKSHLIVELLKLQQYANDYENQNPDNSLNSNSSNTKTGYGRFSQQRNTVNVIKSSPLNYFSSPFLDLKIMKSENQILYYQLLYILCYCLNEYIKVEVNILLSNITVGV